MRAGIDPQPDDPPPAYRGARTTEEYEHPKAGRLRQARNAARFSATPAVIRRPAPALGEHTDEILGELGYSGRDIGDLRAAGALGAKPT